LDDLRTPFATTFAPRFASESGTGLVAPASPADSTRPESSQPCSVLPFTTSDVLRTVTLFRQASSSQLRRLHYAGSYDGTRVRSRKHLTRLTKLGMLKRMWSVYDGAAEYIYFPGDSKAQETKRHTLDVTELYVRLENSARNPSGILQPNTSISWRHESVVFDPEPWRWYNIGPTQLKPDAYIDVGRRYFLEMDRGTEFAAKLADKMRRYLAAFRVWDEERFPQVLFVCHDDTRLRFIRRVIEDQSERELFDVCLFGDAAHFLMR
jgi:Replication-relaxation